MHNIPLLDFYNDLGINPNNDEDNKSYFADGLHPNDKGHSLIADKIISFLENLEQLIKKYKTSRFTAKTVKRLVIFYLNIKD